MSDESTWHPVYTFADPIGKPTPVELHCDGTFLDVALLRRMQPPGTDGTECFSTLGCLASQHDII